MGARVEGRPLLGCFKGLSGRVSSLSGGVQLSSALGSRLASAVVASNPSSLPPGPWGPAPTDRHSSNLACTYHLNNRSPQTRLLTIAETSVRFRQLLLIPFFTPRPSAAMPTGCSLLALCPLTGSRSTDSPSRGPTRRYRILHAQHMHCIPLPWAPNHSPSLDSSFIRLLHLKCFTIANGPKSEMPWYRKSNSTMLGPAAVD